MTMFLLGFVLFLYSFSVIGSVTVGSSNEESRQLNGLYDVARFKNFGLGNVFDMIYPIGSLAQCRRAMQTTVERYRQITEDAENFIAELQNQLRQAQNERNQAVTDGTILTDRLAAANLRIKNLTAQLNQATTTQASSSTQLSTCTNSLNGLKECIPKISTTEGTTVVINNQLYELFYYANAPPSYDDIINTKCKTGSALVTLADTNLLAIATTLKQVYPLLTDSDDMALKDSAGCVRVLLGSPKTRTDPTCSNGEKFTTFACNIPNGSCTF